MNLLIFEYLFLKFAFDSKLFGNVFGYYGAVSMHSYQRVKLDALITSSDSSFASLARHKSLIFFEVFINFNET